MNKTVIATIVAVIVAINQCLMAFGITKFEGVTEESIYAIVSTVAMFVTWAYSHWKNQNFTKEAKFAQTILEALKNGDSRIYDRVVNKNDD